MAKSRISYVALLILAAWIYLVYVDYSALVMLIVILLVPLLLGMVTFFFSRKVNALVIAENTSVTKGAGARVRIKVKNPSIFPFTGAKVELQIEHMYEGRKYNETLRIPVPDREVSQYILEITPMYCGKINVSVRKFVLYDYLGLFAFKRKTASTCSLIAVPEIREAGIQMSECRNEWIDDPVKYSDEEAGDDPSQVFDVREYRAGDKMQKIHWKLTAKKDDLFVKEFSMPVDAAAVILPEFFVSEKGTAVAEADAILETVLMLSVGFLKQEIFHYISWYNAEEQKLMHQEISDEEDVWEAVCAMVSQPLYTGAEGLSLYEQEYRNRTGMMLLYITPQTDTTPSLQPFRVFRICSEGEGKKSRDETLIQTGNIAEALEYINLS